jgi:hypothetical protein
MSNEQEVASSPQPALAADVPQFATAEYAHIPGTERCRVCGSFITGEYYRVNNQMACSTCAAQAKEGQPQDSHAAFLRAVLFGIGGAVAGMIAFATIEISMKFTIGYLGLAVGWLVATAMKKGSNGIGGTRYQIAAVLLTYLAISASAVPVMVMAINREIDKRNQELAQPTPGGVQGGNAQGADQGASVPRVHMNWNKVMGTLALWAVASPFLELSEGANGMIGLVILFVGLSIAFRMTAAKPLAVDGPYSVTAG